MEKIENYKPLGIDMGFNILIDKNNQRFLLWDNGKYKYPIGPMGYVPKSGLFFSEVLMPIVKNKKVLDLGCGEMGIISLFSLIGGAKEVVAVDIDDRCLDWLKHIKETYNLKKLTILKSDMFQNIKGDFDIVVSNPPIMPMKEINIHTVHDAGGRDGRMYLNKIMQDALSHIKDNGNLFLSAFSFLGTDYPTGNQISLKEYALSLGYSSFNVVRKVIKPLSKNSVTYKQLPYIETIYPNMPVLKHKGKTAVEFQILRIQNRCRS